MFFLRKHQNPLPAGWEFEELRNLEQIEVLRPIWQTLQRAEPVPTVNVDIDRYMSVLRISENQAVPYVLLLRKNQQPQAIIVGRCEKVAIDFKLGYKTLSSIPLRGLTVIYGGVLGQPDEEASRLIIGHLTRHLSRGEIDVIAFNRLRAETKFYEQLRHNVCGLYRNHFLEIESHRRMSIPDSIDQFYSMRSKKHRQHLRQYQNKLDREQAGKVRLKTYTMVEEIPQAVQDAALISRNTYQNSLGVGLKDTPQKRSLLREAALNGWFKGHILYIGDEPVAYRFALSYARIYYGDGIGYDPKWGKYRVGTILFLKVLDSLCQDGQVDYYDFGFGDAEYKESYSNESWQEISKIYLFAPRPYTVMINMLSNFNAAMTWVLTWLILKMKFQDWIKRLWRKKMRNIESSDGGSNKTPEQDSSENEQ
jgi:hypothetical protein